MENRRNQIRGLGGNKRTLLEFVGSRSIRGFRQENPEYNTNDQAYRAILTMYNTEVRRFNDAERVVMRDLKKDYYEEKRGSDGNYHRNKYRLLQHSNKILKTDLVKYENNTGILLMEVRVSYDCYLKADDYTEDNKSWLNRSFRGTRSEIVMGNTLRQLREKAEYVKNQLIYGLQNKSAEKNNNFTYKYGNVYNSNNRVPITQIRMRDESTLTLDHATLPSWDMGSGRCVYDALIHLWKMKNSKMEKKANEDYLTRFFTGMCGCDDPLVNGVSVENIIKLATMENFSCYAFNINDLLINKHADDKSRNSKKPAFVFRVHNNHIYMVDDEHTKRSLICKNNENKNIRHKQMVMKYLTNDETVYKNIIPNKEDQTGNDYAIKYIFENKTIPFPFTNKKIKYDKGHILQMVIGDKKIFTEPIDPAVEDYLKTNEIEYTGQHTISLLLDFWKDIYEEEMQHNEFISNMNPIADEVFRMDGIKNRVHIGSMVEDIDTELVGADIIKCYSSILDNPIDDWLCYELTDEIEKYKGELKTGLYLVETDDLQILHQTNWYSNTIIEYALEQGVKLNITKQYIPKKQNKNKDYFKKIIDYVFEKCDMRLAKNIINSITGMMGKTNSSNYKTYLTTDINEIWELLNNESHEHINDFFMNEKTYKDKSIYIYGYKKKENIITNNLPMYIQILDQSNIKLHQLSKTLGGGEIVYRLTDCVVVKKTKEIDDTNLSKDRENWGKYKTYDEDEIMDLNMNYYANRNRHIENEKTYTGWKDNRTFNSSNQYKEIIEYAIEKGGLLICSRAGTGKSYIVNKAVEEKLIDDDQRTRLAFTNKARRNINGTTIHSAISIDKDTEKASVKMIKNYKGKQIIIVDEVSMISSQLWTYLILLKKVSGAVFILLGDYRQLPPVEVNKHDYFNSSIMKYLANRNRIELTERQRYDLPLWDWLNDFYDKGIVGEGLTRGNFIDYKAYNICYYNKTRKRINKLYMEYFKSSGAIVLDADEEIETSQDTWLYKDLPIMAIKNRKPKDKEGGYCNSDSMVIQDIDQENITIKMNIPDENGTDIITCSVNEFHKSFVPNYCSTTHKQQGSTIEGKIQIWDFGKMADDRRIGYTAISRGKSLSNIIIM